MTETLSIKCESRTLHGKAHTRRLRRTNKIPAILYGGSDAPQQLSINAFDWTNVSSKEELYTTVIKLDVEGKAVPVILKAIQRHPTKAVPHHVDFFRADSDKPIVRKLPIRVSGESECYGVKNEGGVLVRQINEVAVKGQLKLLPQFIDINVEELKISESIKLSDLTLDEGISIPTLNRGINQILVAVSSKRGLKAEDDEEVGEEEISEEETSETES